MDDSPVTGRDLTLVREILEVTDPERRAHAEDTGALLVSLERLLDCQATVCVVEAGHALTTARRPRDAGQVLTVQGQRDDAGPWVDLVLCREASHPFTRSDTLLLDLLRPHLAAWLSAPAGRRAPVADQLTTRQLEILRLVQFGMANREVARCLRISEATVRKHLENAFDRLGVLSRTAAVAAAFEPAVTTVQEGERYGRHLRQLA